VQKTAMERQKFKFRDSEECHIHWDISCTSGDVAFTGKLLNISLLWKMIDAILPDVISTMGALSSMLAIKS